MMQSRQVTSQRGFTLIEVMVVVVILAILAALVIPKIITRPEQAKLVKAKQDVLTIENAMDLYRLDNGFYPSTEQGIAALAAKPSTAPVPDNWNGYLKEVPQDPWGHPYNYLNPGKHNEIDIFSLGPTGQANDETVIGNWNVKK